MLKRIKEALTDRKNGKKYKKALRKHIESQDVYIDLFNKYPKGK